MSRHYLKIYPEYFQEVKAGRKKFEVRKNDRDFKVNDLLVLEEFNPITSEYTGDRWQGKITYILEGGNFGIEEGYCVLAIE